jgi:hypothetical protein
MKFATALFALVMVAFVQSTTAQGCAGYPCDPEDQGSCGDYCYCLESGVNFFPLLTTPPMA